ncbi:hypothetical protein Mapa_005332 [Marchantia paleacea]|nr:hypothetical protein Mapa_005332 [Marchantia paleacea]
MSVWRRDRSSFELELGDSNLEQVRGRMKAGTAVTVASNLESASSQSTGLWTKKNGEVTTIEHPDTTDDSTSMSPQSWYMGSHETTTLDG